VISDESKVVKDDQAEPLPAEIVPIFEAARVRRDPLQDLAEEVRIWLGAVRYEASEPQQTGNRTVDITATLDLGTVKQRVFVRCIGGEIRPTDVDSVDKLLDRKIPQGWLISDTRVSESARERAKGQEGLQVFSLSDFLRQKVWGELDPWAEATG
jgi:hypothetical protein